MNVKKQFAPYETLFSWDHTSLFALSQELSLLNNPQSKGIGAMVVFTIDTSIIKNSSHDFH